MDGTNCLMFTTGVTSSGKTFSILVCCNRDVFLWTSFFNRLLDPGHGDRAWPAAAQSRRYFQHCRPRPLSSYATPENTRVFLISAHPLAFPLPGTDIQPSYFSEVRIVDAQEEARIAAMKKRCLELTTDADVAMTLNNVSRSSEATNTNNVSRSSETDSEISVGLPPAPAARDSTESSVSIGLDITSASENSQGSDGVCQRVL